MTHIKRINEMLVNGKPVIIKDRPIVNLKYMCNMVDVVNKKIIKVNGCEFYTIVFKSENNLYGCYYHNINDPGMHGFQGGYETAEEAKDDLIKLIERWF